ncbi:MAG: hypothetical protein Q4C73_05445, partial [Eubacteriales bacterium]|nr:hypothetical protein [Eubacteriales bacterium]
MKQKNCISQLNTDQLEAHLRSAVDALAPDIFDRLDLSVPQERPDSFESSARIVALQRRFRHALAGAAACVFISLAGGGAWHYQYQNIQVDSVIGLDVNPSLELSINRKQRVLKASPLNTEAEDILEDMDLKGVELNVAVNAVVGAMVTHGYFHELDNAVLVTVSNDSVRRAAALRASVVEDIERTLDENQVQAVVYDQQVIEKDEMKTLAEEYGISYGKAYFLKELIDQNDALTMDDMKELSSMTMEQIAERIADSSLELGEYAQKAPDPAQAAEPETEPETSAAEPETAETETETGTDASPDGTKEPQTVAGREQETESASVEEQESDLEELIRIDYVDYEDGLIYVYFADRISWKNPTVLVRDEDGNRYAAMVDDTSADECVIAAEGLDGGKTYVFVLGGIVPEDGSVTAAVTGYFDTPEIDGSLTGDSDDEDDEEAGSPEHGGTGESAGTGE